MASEFIEIISPSTKAELKAIMPMVRELANIIKTINGYKASSTPSGADKSIQGMKTAYKQQGDSIDKVRKELQKLSDAEKDAASKKKASINAMWDAFDKEKKKEKELSDKTTANEIANAEKVAKAEIEKNNKLIQSSQKRADKEAEIEAKKNKRIDELRQAQEAKWSRTGSSSVIPGMSQKISDLKETEKSVLANEKLSRAYVQLTSNREKAKNKLQDLIASETASTAEIRKAQKEFDVLNKKVAAADKAVGRFSDANRKINGLANSVGNLMTAFGVGTGLYLAVDIAKNIYTTTKALQSLDLALKMVSGTQKEFASNQGFLRNLAEQYGIEIKGLTKNFTEFWVASKGKLEAEQIKQVFTSISKSVAVMGLSVEQQDSAFLALQQMMSKGTVQAEELKKQLGNALPGAIKAATMAYQVLHPELKVTEELFMKHMKAGKILSAELLPELAKAYEKLYGIEQVKRAETLQAAQERMQNSWTDLVRSMNSSETGGITKFFMVILDVARSTLDVLTEINSTWDSLAKKAGDKGRLIGSTVFAEVIANAKSSGKDVNKEIKYTLDNARKELSKYKEYEKIIGEDIKEQAKKENSVTWRLAQASNLGLMDTPYDKLQKRRLVILQEIKLQEEIIKQAKNYKEIVKTIPPIIGNDGKKTGTNTKTLKRDDILSVGTPIASKEMDTALEKMKLYRDALVKTRDETAKNASEYAIFEQSIKDVDEAIDHFTKTLEVKSVLGDLEAKVKPYNDSVKEAEENTKRLEKAVQEAFNMFAGDFADRLGFTDTFDLLLGEDKDGNTLFDRLKTNEEHWRDYALAITTVMQDAYNFLNQQSQARFEAEYERLAKQKEVALGFAGDSTAAKEKIEADYEKKHKEIQTREAKAKKKQALFNIALDTAQAIMAVSAKAQWWMISAMIAMGALQMSMVAAQKIPEYWKGTDNAEAGLAWTNERGAEIVTDKHGHIKDFGDDKGARLTMMEKGDKVINAEKTKRLMFNNDLNTMLMDNGIGSVPQIVVNSGMTKAEMREVMMETLGDRPTLNLNMDGNGLSMAMIRKGNVTRRAEQRGSGKGLEF